jgi:transmembrane sensor
MRVRALITGSVLPARNRAMSDLPDEFDHATLARYLSGECGPLEAERIRRWIEADPERRRRMEALGAAWAEAQSGGPAWNPDALWKRISARMDQPAERTPLNLVTRSRRRVTLPLAAAAVALLATGIFLIEQRIGLTRIAEQPAAMREVATAAGQRAQVKLGDGSSVVLGVKSRLRIPTDFGTRARELTLEGQAYFQVVHDSTRPFTVRTAGSRTVDIGTAFVVRAYAADQHVQVVVTEGSVAFGAADADEHGRTVLSEARLGRLAKGETVPEVKTVDPAMYTDWLQGRLTFDNAPLDEVAAELGRWYDVEVHLADSALARETLTATFGSESLTEAVATITTVLQLDAERRGTAVILRRPGR